MRRVVPPGALRLVAVLVATAAVGAALVAPVHASERDADEVRVHGTCGGSARSDLRLRADDDELELRFEVARAGRGAWRVAVVHERRVVWKGTAQPQGSSRSFAVRRALPDLDGADAVTVRAWGPQGAGCRATAVLVED